MKIRLRLRKTTKPYTISEEIETTVTIAELRQVAIDLFQELTFEVFDLSLNNSDIIQDETLTLGSLGIVSGDLIFIISHQQQDTDVTDHSNTKGLQDTSVTDGNKKEITKHIPMEVSGSYQMEEYSISKTETNRPVHSDIAVSSKIEEGANSDSRPDSEPPVDMTLVNKYLKEPMLCHDATDTTLPPLLIQTYHDAQPADRTEALCVVLHVLMLEVGYTTCDTQNGAVNLKDCCKSFTETWKHPGCYKFQYTYPWCEEGTVSLTVIPAGNLVVVHGKVKSPSEVKSWQCKLKVDDFVRCVTSGCIHCYKSLSKLSAVFKDSIALPLLNDLRSSVGKPEAYGFLALTQEVKSKIISFLDVKSTVIVSEVNNELLMLSRDPYIWRRHYLREFKNRSDNSLSQDWYKLYKEQHLLRKEHKKQLKQIVFIEPPYFQPVPMPYFPAPWRPPGPGFIGGDYDLFPNFSGPIPMLPRPRFDPMGPIPGMFPRPGRRGGFGGMGPRFF
ncbi:hypothetical protein CHS0354_018816 [Potamilus streckersoni]|uniref:Ubiquitin-like domain-containing protein n=1 Tax=Potamilus streckersoni TaxID=2493646 RepID=A0AAE0TIC5_9BIVA|nr:hypothetical protein CHS0354_018816 [Potamilus streckersoni]